MRLAVFTAVLLLGCAASHGRGGPGDPDARVADAGPGPTPDASGPDASGPDAGGPGCSGTSRIWCVESCHTDIYERPECRGGEWQCPDRTFDVELCTPATECHRAPTAGSHCYSEGEVCGTCCPERGEWEPMVCEDERWTPAVCPDVECERVAEVCSAAPRDHLGEPCDIEGQACGDECCGNSAVCRDGHWMLGPEALCYACLSFRCGSGLCQMDAQYCRSHPGPDDGAIFECVQLPEGCTDCSCIPLREGYVCEMVDGHPHVSGGWRGI